MQIHSSRSSYSSNDIFMNKVIPAIKLEKYKNKILSIESINFRGEDTLDGVLGYYFELNPGSIKHTESLTLTDMIARVLIFSKLGFEFDTSTIDIPEKNETPHESIVRLIKEINKELLTGWTYKCYALNDLIDLIYINHRLTNIPKNKHNPQIIELCEEILLSFEEGMSGIREVETLISLLSESLELTLECV